MGEANRVRQARANGINIDPLVQERLKRAQDQIRAKFKRVEARSEAVRFNQLDKDLESDMDPRIYGGFRRSAKIQDSTRVRQEGAGNRGGICYRTACQKPDSAVFFNHSTQKWYCEECAHWLNTDTFNQKDAMDLYGGPLCVSEEEYDAMPQEDKVYGRSRLRTERREHPENF